MAGEVNIMPQTESDKELRELDALRYALSLVQGRRVLKRHPAYLAACEEMEIFLQAAIERVENGEPMWSLAEVQEPSSPRKDANE